MEAFPKTRLHTVYLMVRYDPRQAAGVLPEVTP